MVCCASFVLEIGSAARAEGTVDMSKYTCEKLLQGTANSIEAAIWLSGYYNGLRKNTKFNLDQFKKNAEVIIAECKDNPKATVMQTIKTIMFRNK